MSTKKTLKRVALAAVSALGFGLMAVVPANAVAQPNLNCTVAVTITDGGVCSTIAGPANFVTLTNSAGSSIYVVLTGGTFTDGTAAKTLAAGGTANVSATAAGTITAKGYLITAGAAATTATDTVAITVVTALAGTVYASSTIAVGDVAGAGTIHTYTDPVSLAVTRLASSAATAATPLYSFTVTQKDAAGTALAAGSTKAITAALSGVGSLSLGGTATSQFVTVAAASANNQVINVFADGRAGKGTLTISVNGVAVKTYDIHFWGTTVASYDFGMDNAHIAVGGVGSATVVAKDVNGQAIPNVLVNFASATTDNATVAATATTSGCAVVACSALEWAAFGSASPAVTGVAVGTSVITAANAAASATVTKTATATVTGAVITSVAWAFDKASYEPGEKATITVTLKDAAGNPLGDKAAAYNLWGTVPSANVQVNAVTGAAATAATVSGVVKYTYYMPTTAGTVTFTGKLAANADLAAALQGTTQTLSATVTGGAAAAAAEAATDAALEAIDAANAATDAANLAAEAADAATVAAEEARDAADAATAAVEALATQVSEMIADLKTQLTALANTVAKIAKKVKA